MNSNNCLRMFLLTDGTGEPNLEGIEYYNSLIDALLGKGFSITGLNESNSHIIFRLLKAYLLFCIRNPTLCNSLSLGSSTDA